MKIQTSDEYIDYLISSGTSTPAAIKEAATQKLKEIEDQLSKLNELREEKSILLDVLKSYNEDITKYSSRKKLFKNNNEVDYSSIKTDEDIENKVIDIFRQSSYISLKKVDILTQIGYDKKDPSQIYLVLKKLFEKGILTQNEDRTLSKGPDWNG